MFTGVEKADYKSIEGYTFKCSEYKFKSNVVVISALIYEGRPGPDSEFIDLLISDFRKYGAFTVQYKVIRDMHKDLILKRTVEEHSMKTCSAFDGLNDYKKYNLLFQVPVMLDHKKIKTYNDAILHILNEEYFKFIESLDELTT